MKKTKSDKCLEILHIILRYNLIKALYKLTNILSQTDAKHISQAYASYVHYSFSQVHNFTPTEAHKGHAHILF